jgi:hypothetical protein
MKPKKPTLYRVHDNTLDDHLQVAYVLACFRESLYDRLPCPRCSADAYLCPWAYNRQEWQCLTPGCNWQCNYDTAAHLRARKD